MRDVLAVARADGLVVRRSRLLWGVVAIYVGLMALLFYPSSDDVAVSYSVVGATWLTTLLVPLVAIAGSYLAIAGERESRTIRFLLSQPVRRRSIVLGKFLSRGLTLSVGLLVAFGVAVALVFGLYASPTLAPLWSFFGLSILLVLSFVAVSIGASAAVATRSRAVSVTMGYYFVGVVLSVLPWASIESALRRVGEDGLGLGLDPDLYTLVASLLSPADAYLNATFSTFPADVGTPLPAFPPAYLELPFQTAILVAWIVVPLALGSVLLGRAEIG